MKAVAMQVHLEQIKSRNADPRIAAAFTAFTLILTIAGIGTCTTNIGSMVLSASGLGLSASASYKIGFTKVTATGAALGQSASVTYPIDSQPCSNFVYSSSSSSSSCVSSGSGSSVTLCIPQPEFGLMAGAKACASFAIIVQLILVILYFMKKHGACSVCGLHWLSMILTIVAVALAIAGAAAFYYDCTGYSSSSFIYPTFVQGDGSNLLIASVSIQFFVWIFAQVACVASTPNQTVIVVQNQAGQPLQYGQQQYASNVVVQPMAAADNRPLPPGWEVLTDTSGNRYYGCPTAHTTQYEFPTQPAPLPPGWEALTDASGNRYYGNPTLKTTQYEFPKH